MCYGRPFDTLGADHLMYRGGLWFCSSDKLFVFLFFRNKLLYSLFVFSKESKISR